MYFLFNNTCNHELAGLMFLNTCMWAHRSLVKETVNIISVLFLLSVHTSIKSSNLKTQEPINLQQTMKIDPVKIKYFTARFAIKHMKVHRLDKKVHLVIVKSLTLTELQHSACSRSYRVLEFTVRFLYKSGLTHEKRLEGKVNHVVVYQLRSITLTETGHSACVRLY